MATVVPKNETEVAATAAKLLKAAKGDPSKVRPVTSGPVVAFEVDDDVVAALAPKKPAAKKPPAGGDSEKGDAE